MEQPNIPARQSSGHARGHSISSDAPPTSGDFSTLDKRGTIRQWIEDIDQIDHFHSRTSMAGMELNSVISSDDSHYGRHPASSTVVGSDLEMPSSKERPALDPFLDEDFDSEDDFFVDAALSALEKGRTAFKGDDFVAADAYLREALVMIKDLAKKQQSVCDTWELRRMLGICAFHVHAAVEAEHALMSVLENAPKTAVPSNEQRLHISETAHLLAQVDVKLGKLDKAYRYCEYALRGRRKVLGKSSEQSYDSLALLSRILELQNNSIRAEFFVGMVPEAERSAYIRRFADLVMMNTITATTSEILPSDAISSVSVQRSMSTVAEPLPVPEPAPQIPHRSPSRGSMSPAASAISALRPDEVSRPISALSQQASPKTSEYGDTRTVSSVSAPGSPPNLAAPFGSLPSPPTDNVGRPHLGASRGVDRPYNVRSHSHSGSGLSATQGLGDMMPQPLRTSQQQQQHQQRDGLISELPGDNYHSSQPSVPLRIKRENTSISRLPDPPRSVPIGHETQHGDASARAPFQPQPPLSDRECLPSRVVQTLQINIVKSPSRTPINSSFAVQHNPLAEEQHRASPVPPTVGSQHQYLENPLSLSETHITDTNSTAGKQQDATSDSATMTIPKQPPPLYEDVTVQQPSQPANVLPDVKRSDFQNSAWSPPLQVHPAERHGNLPFMLPTNEFAPPQPVVSPPVVREVERWAAQDIAPSGAQAADRQSITSSSFSESNSTIQSHSLSHHTLPSSTTNISQHSGKTSKRGSLLKAFRSSSSTVATTGRIMSMGHNTARLSRKDVDSMKSDILSNGSIDFWQGYLEQELLNGSTRFILMRPARTSLLQESIENLASFKAALLDVAPIGNDESGTLHIFIPLQNPKRPSHRSLLLVSPQDGLACHYDSRQPWNRKVAESLTARISELLPGKPLEFLDVPDVPQLANEKDSAVFVCMFMQHLILKVQNTHVGQKVNAGLECRVEGKSARKVILKLVEARRKSGQVVVE